MSTTTLFIINDAPYGNERAYNALRLAGALSAKDEQHVRVFLMADAVGCAKAGQKVPEGFYNVQLMLNKVTHKGGSRPLWHLHGRPRPHRTGPYAGGETLDPGAARGLDDRG